MGGPFAIAFNNRWCNRSLPEKGAGMHVCLLIMMNGAEMSRFMKAAKLIGGLVQLVAAGSIQSMCS